MYRVEVIHGHVQSGGDSCTEWIHVIHVQSGGDSRTEWG